MSSQQCDEGFASSSKVDLAFWNFSDWQVELLRSRLWMYHQHGAKNGKKRPWGSVLHDILILKATSHTYPEDGGEIEWKEEALRRFGKGINKRIDAEKLRDICLFLLEHKYLRLSEINNEPFNFKDAVVLHHYLASDTSLAKKYMKLLPCRYVSREEEEDVIVHIELNIDLDEKEHFLRVKETYELYVNECSEEGGDNQCLKSYPIENCHYCAKDGYKCYTRKRAGFGFVSTEHNILLIFVYGEEKNDLVAYTQASVDIKNYDTVSSLLLARTGQYSAAHVRGRYSRYEDHYKQSVHASWFGVPIEYIRTFSFSPRKLEE
jgi:hypothetical protein